MSQQTEPTLTLGAIITTATNTLEEANETFAAKVAVVQEITERTQLLNCRLMEKLQIGSLHKAL